MAVWLGSPFGNFVVLPRRTPSPPEQQGSSLSLSAPHAAPGASLTILGSGFGASQGASTVTFGERLNSKDWSPHGRPAAVASWSNTSITCTVPSMAPGKAGAVNTYQPVYVTVNGVMSDSADFYVDPATTITGQSYSLVNRSGYNNILYDGCSFTNPSGGAGTSAMLINDSTNCVTFHNCTFSSACNGSTINRVSTDVIRDVVFSDCTWNYCDRMAFECTSRDTGNWERVAIRGGSVYPAGSEAVSFDGHVSPPAYGLIKDCTIRGAGNSGTYTEWPHGLEFNDLTYCMAKNVTIKAVRGFSLNINIGLNPGTNSHWVFENVYCNRNDIDAQQTATPSTSGRCGLFEYMNFAYFLDCSFNAGNGFNNAHFLESSYNEFDSCDWLGANDGVSEYTGCTGNTGLPT